MIYVSQGHEKGIGLEIFFKAAITLPQHQLPNITLFANKESVSQTLNSLGVMFELSENDITIGKKKLSVRWLKDTSNYQSSDSLLAILNIITTTDILVTLPTSKEQIYHQKKQFNGHTEFFRHYFGNKQIGMVFISPSINLLLLTDHVPLSKVPKAFSKNQARNKIERSLASLSPYRKIDTLIFLGINPHNGENGLIGNEDKKILELQDFFSSYKTLCSPGDSAFNQSIDYKKSLLISPFHDQGLTGFKSLNKFVGINFSTDLPFVRLSVDHGTGFDLYGKNMANFMGMKYVLDKAVKWNGDTN